MIGLMPRVFQPYQQASAAADQQVQASAAQGAKRILPAYRAAADHQHGSERQQY